MKIRRPKKCETHQPTAVAGLFFCVDLKFEVVIDVKQSSNRALGDTGYTGRCPQRQAISRLPDVDHRSRCVSLDRGEKRMDCRYLRCAFALDNENVSKSKPKTIPYELQYCSYAY